MLSRRFYRCGRTKFSSSQCMLTAREPLCWLCASLDPGPLAAEEDMNELWSKPRPKAALWALLQWWLVSSWHTMGCMGWLCSSQGWEEGSAEQRGQQGMKTLIKRHKVKFPFFQWCELRANKHSIQWRGCDSMWFFFLVFETDLLWKHFQRDNWCFHLNMHSCEVMS